jgi:diguanylate cyclase (GGDEF)-like protein/PAS domain S-box-containing protein
VPGGRSVTSALLDQRRASTSVLMVECWWIELFPQPSQVLIPDVTRFATTSGNSPPSSRTPPPALPATEPPINELPEPDLLDETSAGLARHSVGERVRLLEAVVGQASDALVLSSKDDDDPVIRIRFVNQAFTRMLGFGLGDVAGQSPGVLVGPETDLETLRRVEAALRLDETVTAELVLHDADGTPVRVEATYRVVATGSGSTWYLASYRDLSDRVEAAAALRRSEAWAEAMVQGSSDLVMVADVEGVVRYVSPAITEVLGYDPEDFVARVFADVIHPDDLHRSNGLFDAVRSGRGRTRGKGYEFRVSHRDGGWRTVSLRVADRLDDPAVRGFVVNLRDVSDRQRAEELLAEQADLLEAIARGAPLEITLGKITAMVERHVQGVIAVIGMLDDDGVIRLRSTSELPEEMVRFYDDLPPTAPGGVALRSGVGDRFVFDLVDGPNLGAAAELFARHGFTQARTCRLRAPGAGDLVGVLTIFSRIAGDLAPSDLQVVQRATNLAAIAIERHQFAAALEYQALYDPLTDLPNRALLSRRIHEALVMIAGGARGVAVLFIDLDRFKVINDSEGHAVGDIVLQQVAERFRGRLQPGETLGRFGGDEFMVVCSALRSEREAAAAADRFAAELSEPLVLADGSELFVTASIGIAYSTDASVPAESLIRNADVAMYRAKDQGRNQRVAFQENVDQRAVEQLALERALRAAIETRQFELHYQPVVQLSDGSMTQVEALVRWNRPGHGLELPASFIPIAEETGLIVPIGWWVLGEAVAQAASWPTLPDGKRVEVAVNLSARQLADAELVDVVSDALEHTGLDPARLCFEVTESALVHDVEHAVKSLNRLKELGVRIAIDDFGTGYATLDYVRHFSMADYLKIDRAFIEGVDRPGSQEAAIVSAAVALAKSLGFTVVAEGVETLLQMEALRDLECELAQGYLFSRPVPIEEAVVLLSASDGLVATD